MRDAFNLSCADVLAKMHVGAVFLRSRGLTSKADDLEKARTAVAELIEREAAQAKRIAELEQIAAGHRDGRLAALEKAAALESERDALAAEVEALREALQKLVDFTGAYGGPYANARSLLSAARASAATGGTHA